MSSKAMAVKVSKTSVVPPSKVSSRHASPLRSNREARPALPHDGISRPQTPNSQHRNHETTAERPPLSKEQRLNRRILAVLSKDTDEVLQAKEGRRPSSLTQKTQSSLSGQPTSQNSLPREDPRYHAWKKFMLDLGIAMSTRVSAADLRLKQRPLRQKLMELNAALSVRIVDVETHKGEFLGDTGTAAGLLDASKALSNFIAEFDAAAEKYYQVEEDLVKEESQVYDQAPTLLSEKEETFEALKRLGFDFHLSEDSYGAESNFSWTSRIPLAGVDTLELQPSSTKELLHSSNNELLQSSNNELLHSSTKELNELEDQILLVRRERGNLMRKVLMQDPEVVLEPDRAAMFLIDQKHRELEIIYKQTLRKFQFVRDSTSDDSDQSSYHQHHQQVEHVVETEFPDVNDHDAIICFYMIDSLFVRDAEQMPFYASLYKTADPVPISERVPMSERINLWLLHSLRCRISELTRLARFVSDICGRIPSRQIALDVFTRLWREDGTEQLPSDGPATRPAGNLSSVEMNVAPTGASVSKKHSTVTISNLAVSHSPM